MNRRGFISTLAGAAGASLVSWRLPDPVIILAPIDKSLNDFVTDNLRYKSSERYSTLSFTDPRGLYGSAPISVNRPLAYVPYWDGDGKANWIKV
jgi:hypothetical protein